jgi:acyl carrier protein
MNSLTLTDEHKDSILAFIQTKGMITVPIQDAMSQTVNALGMDSLELIDLAFDIETHLNLRLDLDLIASETTLAELLDFFTPV